MTTAAQRNKLKQPQKERVVKLLSKTRSQLVRRRAQVDVAAVVEVRAPQKLTPLSQEMTHTTEVMKSQDSVTACAVPISVEDASVLVDALAQNAAERRIDMFQVMVYPIQVLTKQLRKKRFLKEVQ